MSLLTFFINKQMLPIFLHDIIKIRNFHVKKSEFELESHIIKEDELKNLYEQLDVVQNYINEIISQTEIHTEKIQPPKNNERVILNFSTISELINDLAAKTENVYFRLKRISDGLDESQENLEKMAKLAHFLNLISKFGGQQYCQKDFKQLTFKLLLTSEKHYHELERSINHLNSPILVHGEKIAPNIIGFFTFYEKENEKEMSDFFLSYNCQKIEIPEEYLGSPGIRMDLLKEDHESLISRKNNFSKVLEKTVKELPQVLMGFYEILENSLVILGIVKEIQQTPSRNIIKVKGYVPTNIEKKLITALKSQFKNNIRIESLVIERSDPYEEKEKDGEEEKEEKFFNKEESTAPTLLKLGSIVKPFSGLVKLYGTTNYSEIDPSIFLVITFPIIFGLMFGDIGHGLVLIIAGIIGWLKNRKKGPKSSSFLLVILYCGFGSILGGLMYGECFGKQYLFSVPEWELYPILAHPMEDIVQVLKLSIIVGVSIITLGYIIKIFNLILNHRKFLAFSEPFLKILLLIGGTYLILTYTFDINAWIAPPSPILLVVIPSFILILIKPVGKILHISYLKDASVGGLIGESALDFSETMLQIISNVASFVRILALEMAHIGLMIVVSEIVNMLGIPGVNQIVEIFGNAFVIVLEVILVMIHCLRLHFYEFFSKFYIADGIEFKPISINDEFSLLDFNDLPNIENSLEFNV
ncbi:MAG: V-type ATP synthase subunit I [Promethearchaeota archaeon]